MEKRELLFEDAKAIKKEKRRAMSSSIELNNYLNVAQGILGELTDDQKMILKADRHKFIQSEIEKKFMFPKATQEFNLTALGIDLKPIEKLNTNTWSEFNFFINSEGYFQLEEDQPAYEVHRTYSDNEKIKKTLEIANSFENLFAEAQANGLVNGMMLQNVATALKMIVKVEGDPRGSKCKIIVNKQGVADSRYFRNAT